MEQVQLRQRLPQVAIILIFLLSLFVPLLGWLLDKDLYYSEAEKRELLTFPKFQEQQSITGFTHAFDQYYQDHFGQREWFIHRYQREMSKRFGATGSPDVVEGLDNWLFYGRDSLLEDLQGQHHFSRKQQQLFWKRLQERELWFRERGVAYMFLIAPNKQSVYPEYLPQTLQESMGETGLDRLLAGKPPGEGKALLDIRSRLRQEKGRALLYDKSDTHWNSLGAYYAHQAVIEQTRLLFPDFQVPVDFHFAKEFRYRPGGDLAVMSGRSKSMPEGRPVLETADFVAAEKPLPGQLADLLTPPALQPQYTENPNGRLRVLVLHDSFFNKLRPFVSESYGEVLYVWKYYDTETLQFFSSENLTSLMAIYQPDLVIEETVERRLVRFLFPYVKE